MHTKLLKTAAEAAKAAGKVHKKYFNTPMKIRTKTTSFDRVTEADLAAEAVVVEIVKKQFPGHNILAEENKYEKTDSEYCWIIDPLDGTNNFSHGMPIFCVSVACACRGEVIAGAIYDVSRDELFSATKGGGAFLNKEPISVTDVPALNKALLITGFYYDRGRDMEENLDCIKRFFRKDIIGIRRLGAAALDLCYVACGRASGFWEFELSPWDFAAGKLIVEEAGGKVTGRAGAPLPLEKHFVVSSNGLLHDEMLSVINAEK